jgi:hypothetical protein
VERELNSRITELVGSESFAIAAGLRSRVVRGVAAQSERGSRRVLHLLNLPAGSDINRLLRHIASLEREVRDVQKTLQDRLVVDDKGQQDAGVRARRRSRTPAP